jgi:hypothetical protein
MVDLTLVNIRYCSYGIDVGNVGTVSELEDLWLGVASADDATTQFLLFSSFSRKLAMGEASQLYLTQFAKKKLTFICIQSRLFYFLAIYLYKS